MFRAVYVPIEVKSKFKSI